MILETLLTAVSVIALAFSSEPPKPPPTPTPPPDTEAEAARAQQFADAQKRRGRRSTILTRGTGFGLAGSQSTNRKYSIPDEPYAGAKRSTLG
jgi:hypothetical protein